MSQSKLQNWVTNNLVTGGYGLSYDELDEFKLQELIDLAEEVIKKIKEPEDEIISAVWSEVDWDLEEET